MRFLISDCYSGEYGKAHDPDAAAFPDDIENKIKELGLEFPLNRTGEIIDYIESNYIPNEYQGADDKVQYEQFAIVEIDTSRPWCIKDYDDFEYFVYLDYDVVNEELNFCKMRCPD